MVNSRYFKLRECTDCGKKIRKGYRKYLERIICYHCFRKRITVIRGNRSRESLKEALEKVYEIKGYLKQNTIGAYRTFPSILIGHKVKLVLEDQEFKDRKK